MGGGVLSCTPNCLFDTSQCGGLCGNGTVNIGEQCDMEDLQGFTCLTLGLGDGELACTPGTCTFDTTDCTG